MSDMYFKSLPDKSTPLIPENLDKLNDIKVSPTEPTANEKVWIQKGKNLSKISGFDAVNSDLGRATIKINVKENTRYTISAIKSRIDGVIIENGWFQGIGAIKAYGVSGNLLEDLFRDNAHYHETGECIFDFTITTPVNCDYIVVDFANNNGDLNLNTSVSNIQIEQGSATEYEEYIEKAIWCKNDNGVYEEFLDVEKARNSAQLETTPQTPNGNTKITYMQLLYDNGFVLYLKAITDGVEHSFKVNLTQID